VSLGSAGQRDVQRDVQRDGQRDGQRFVRGDGRGDGHPRMADNNRLFNVARY